MEKNAGKVREFCQSGKVGTMFSDLNKVFVDVLAKFVMTDIKLPFKLPMHAANDPQRK